MKRLWLDDVRPAPEGWVHVYTASQAIAALQEVEWDEVSLDHDLGEDLTGYNVVCFIERVAFHGGYVPPVIKCHSDNPPGRRAINEAIKSIERMRK